jgi:predicted transcriptional regulator
MTADLWLDALQTVALLVLGGAQIYVIWRLEREIGSAARTLRQVMNGQTEAKSEMDKLKARIEAVAQAQDIKADADALAKLKRFLDAVSHVHGSD